MYSNAKLKGTLSLSVSDLTRYLRQLMESDEVLQDVWVQGEISNLGRPASGHIYFTLKDSGASLRCVIWRSNALRISTPLLDGVAVEAHGCINLYEAGGQYQLNTDSIRPKGEGFLYQEFLRLKNLLEAEGLFKSEKKRAIPKFAKRIGIITSLTGAALQDMLNILKRRNPMLDVTIAPSAVQGMEAPSELVKALKYLNKFVKPELILLARGGGSIEDLWAFNDERVVRAIVASSAPVISGIGHETDFTLSDFAADLRAPTPTAAAELATPITILDMKDLIEQASSNILIAVEHLVQQKNFQIQETQNRLKICSPERRIQNEWQSLDTFSRRMIGTHRHRFLMEKTRLKGLGDRLLSLNPIGVLKRGYAVVTRNINAGLITKTEQIVPGEKLIVRVQNGTFPVLVSSQDKEGK
jgi:exodeoxyribonuclease VII large subunit